MSDPARDLKRLYKDLEKLKGPVVKKSVAQAINKALTKAKTTAKQEVTKQANIKAAAVAQTLFVKRASVRHLGGYIDARTGRARNLADYVSPAQLNTAYARQRTAKGKYKRKGVKARPYERSKVHEGTFIGRGKTSGKLLVYKRKSKGRDSKLEALRGPSIRQIVTSAKVKRRVNQRMLDEYPVEFERAFRNNAARMLSRR